VLLASAIDVKIDVNSDLWLTLKLTIFATAMRRSSTVFQPLTPAGQRRFRSGEDGIRDQPGR
jgi:hypothetical protein